MNMEKLLRILAANGVELRINFNPHLESYHFKLLKEKKGFRRKAAIDFHISTSDMEDFEELFPEYLSTWIMELDEFEEEAINI